LRLKRCENKKLERAACVGFNAARSSGGYWHAMEQQAPEPQVLDEAFQDRLVAMLESMTDVALG
jgi:hypothetical protein